MAKTEDYAEAIKSRDYNYVATYLGDMVEIIEQRTIKRVLEIICKDEDQTFFGWQIKEILEKEFEVKE